jgi:hypothetical protein
MPRSSQPPLNLPGDIRDLIAKHEQPAEAGVKL